MIKDNIENYKIYSGLSYGIKLGLEYLKNTDFSKVENGKYLLNDEVVYANVQDYTSKKLEDGKFEAHRNYIDIQYIAEGEEQIGVGDISNYKSFIKYVEENDIEFLNPIDENFSTFIKLKKGDFAIFYPHDAHMPQIAIDDNQKYVKKVVIKVQY